MPIPTEVQGAWHGPGHGLRWWSSFTWAGEPPHNSGAGTKVRLNQTDVREHGWLNDIEANFMNMFLSPNTRSFNSQKHSNHGDGSFHIFWLWMNLYNLESQQFQNHSSLTLHLFFDRSDQSGWFDRWLSPGTLAWFTHTIPVFFGIESPGMFPWTLAQLEKFILTLVAPFLTSFEL